MESTEPVDVVVLGSGAAGLTAAFTAAAGGASVAVYEKSDLLGGTSAWSGGHVWIANNPHMAAVDVADSEEEAMEYIMSLSRGKLDENLVRTMVDAGPDMVSFLDDRANMGFYVAEGFPDYHPNQPGGKPGGGRTIETGLFPFDELGEWADKISPSPYMPPHLIMREVPLGSAVPQPPTAEEVARRAEHNERGMGQGLIGRLLKACLEAGVRIHASHQATELIIEGDRVTGVRFETPDGPAEVMADRGVVLATGGFEWNEEFKRTFLRGPLTHPVSMPTLTGDGLKMAMKAGAKLGNMGEAWWSPVAELPAGSNPMDRVMVNADRTRPRSIVVNRLGRRFANEASSYNAFGGAMHQEDTGSHFDYANLPCWLIFDHGYFRRYGTVGPTPAAEQAPDWLLSADSLDELAAALEIPADGLKHTVETWNGYVADGYDPDFHRGESAHDLWWGDPHNKGAIGATLGALDTPPFHAVPLQIGSLGTKGGPQTDGSARVLDLDGQPILGLYAAGNVMASPYGMAYAGAGGTLGPAMTFGYLAGKDLSDPAKS
ncbi:MAG: putative oxidoreductase [Pseudonocardiales bacterium]|nr:putative oxidoreductase [Pseudonocardiales bacterium]